MILRPRRLRLQWRIPVPAVINGSPVQDGIHVTAPPGLALTVNALAGDDLLSVLGAGDGSTVAVNAGEGNDTVIVGSPTSGAPPASALAIQAPVTIDGGACPTRASTRCS
jgi:hypothetical protein